MILAKELEKWMANESNTFTTVVAEPGRFFCNTAFTFVSNNNGEIDVEENVGAYRNIPDDGAKVVYLF